MKYTQSIFQKELGDVADYIKRRGEDIKRLMLLERVFQGISLADVSHFYQSGLVTEYDTLKQVSVNLTLKEDKRDSKLAHKIARKFHVKFTKAKAWYGDTLILNGTIPADDLHGIPEISITINGAVPATCKVVEKRTPMTEEEIEAAKAAALAKVPTERVERVLVCGGKAS